MRIAREDGAPSSKSHKNVDNVDDSVVAATVAAKEHQNVAPV